MGNWYDIVPEWVFGEKKQAVNPMQPIAYTGNGGDGVVQPRRPVEMVQSKQGPVMLHEGEGKMENPDGSITVVPQSKLQQMEAITGMRGMADGGTYDPANQLKPITNSASSSTDYFNQGMKAIADTASGNSPALKNMENTATQNFTGSALASSGAAKQSGAQAGYDMKAIANVEQRNARNLEGERSNLMNTIAQTKQSAATNAQQQLVTGGLQGRSQDLIEKQYTDTKNNADWDRMLLYYDPSTPEGLSQLQSAYTEMFGGKTPDFNVLKEQRDYAQKKQQQDVSMGEKTLTAADLQNISTQFGIDQSKASSVISAINQGATKDYLLQAFGVTLTDDQYNAMRQQYTEQRQTANLMIAAQQLQNISTQLGIDVTSSQAVVQAINNGATKDYIKQKFGVDLTDDQFNSLSTEYGQKVQLGTLSVTSAELANTAAQMGIDSAKIQNIVSAINSGATKDFLSNYLGVNLTDDQYKSLKEQYVQKIQLGNLTVTSQDLANTASQLGIDSTKSQAVIHAINSGATKDYIQQSLGVNLTDEQYNSMKKKYSQSITAGDYELEQLKTTVGDQKFNSVIGRIAAGSSISSINKELGTNITDAEYNQMWEASETYFKKQGLTMEKAALYGYTDENGQHVKGSMENAAEQLGLQSKTFDLQKEELAKKYDLLTAEDKRAADGFYGYDVKDSNGNVVGRVKGSLELANDASTIQKQGLDLETAQIKGYIDDNGNFIKGSVQLNAEKQGIEVSSLYGYYYDPKTGQVITDSEEIARRGDELERVDGSLSLAAKTFGLQSKTYEDQRLEMFGGYDPGTKNYITGKMQLLSNEDQRAADQLYGKDEWVFDEKGNTVQVHRPGTLELQAEEINIKNQGLSIEEAKLYGYEKLDKDGNPTGERVKGALEIESQKMDMLEDEYDKQQESAQGTALASHFALMANTKGYNYQNDKQAQKLLQDYWTATTGDAGPYDQEWADRQFNASTVTEVDAALQKMQASDWYKAMGEKEQKNAIETVRLAAMLSVTGGMTPKYDENGQVVGLLDEEGEVVLDLNPTPTDASAIKIPDGKVAGDTFIANGNKYRVNDDGKTTTEVAYEEWQKTYDQAKDDPRFEELTASGKLDAQKWKESGAKTIDEYLDYTKTKEKYGEAPTGLSLAQDNKSLLNAEEKSVNPTEYSTILKGANDVNSPNYNIYKSLLDSVTTIKPSISDVNKNTLQHRQSNGTLVNIDGRLLMIKSQGRFTKGGRDADTITYVDVATGKEQTFSGRKSDGNAGKSINNLSNWVTSLGV